MIEFPLKQTRWKYLVIGGDSLLGKAVIEHLKRSGQKVITTTRRRENISDSSLFLDLSGDISLWDIPEGIDNVLLCASVTKIEQCRRQPEESRKVNVDNILSLAARLSEREISIIYPSTSLVFDGKMPFRHANDPVNPQCEYGYQKVETELGLGSLTERVAIIRFAKIIEPAMPLINNWIANLKQGKTIHPFSDMVLAPVSLRYAVKVIIAVMEKKSYGLWQVSAKEDITYEQLARYVTEKRAVPQKLIQPVKAEQSGLKLETIPAHTTLDTSRLHDELGIEPPSAWETVDEILRLQNEHP
jgi:dTDP-4-dehydrorhamnose reductase